MDLNAKMFQQEMSSAVKMYDKYVVCLDKTPDQFEESLTSLMAKAIKAYAERGANMRHGIALDKQVTIILSQTDGEIPLCGIYFNLHTPYRKKASTKTAK